MSTATPQPILHVFKEYNIGKFKTTRHYKIESVTNGVNQLTDIINISKDRKCAQSMPAYWLQIREGKKWKKPRLTGLFNTIKYNVFKGDIDKKRHLVLFQFSDKANTLTIYYFQNYYTTNLSNVWDFLVD
ncbi:hypothetical protein [Winogradskyella poriferorum]|uniref:hypothetical protein n=1 Tax=Winogradskyella poriferorum TaxID=307627 RepID=UPI003D64EFF7